MNKKIYVYADESGNSGKNLFDEASPYFYQAGIVTVGGLDEIVAPVISDYTEKYDVDRLHANVIAKKYGFQKVLEICGALYETLKDEEWMLHCSIIEKKYIPVVKLFDTFFDYYENRSVDPAWMRIEYNRHLIIFHLHLLMKGLINKRFWEALCTQNQEEAKWICTQLIVMAKKIENKNVRDAIQKTLAAAYEDIGRFTFFKERGKSRYKGHTPNMIGFDSLNHFVQDYCQKNEASVHSFTHDLSDEFKGNMRESHKFLKKLRFEINDEAFLNVVNSDFDLGDFYIKSSTSNCMLQVTDIFLWVIQKIYPNPCKGFNIKGSAIELLLENNFDWFLLSSSNSFRIIQEIDKK